MHQVGDQPRLYCDARSTNHQELIAGVTGQGAEGAELTGEKRKVHNEELHYMYSPNFMG